MKMKKLRLPIITVTLLILMMKQGVSQYLNEGYEGGTLPSGWTEEIVSTEQRSWLYQAGGYDGTSILAAHSGNFNALFYDDTYGNYTPSVTRLVTPVMDLSSAVSPQLTFWHAQQNWSGDQDELRVYYKIFPGGSWILLPGATFVSNISSWTMETFSLPNVTSTYYLAFEATGKFGYGIVLDDVIVEESSTVGIAEENAETTSNIFPNPASGSFQFKSVIPNNDIINEVEIYDLLGNLVNKIMPEKTGNNLYSIDISDIDAGMYYLTYMVNSKKYSEKLIIK
jgi:hypothetical protein